MDLVSRNSVMAARGPVSVVLEGSSKTAWGWIRLIKSDENGWFPGKYDQRDLRRWEDLSLCGCSGSEDMLWRFEEGNKLWCDLVQSLTCFWLSATPWTAAHQTFLSFSISWSLLKIMSSKSVIPSNPLILCHCLLLPLIFLSLRVFFSVSWLVASGGWSIGTSASASVLAVYIQGWFPLALIDLISLLFKGLSSDFSSTTVWRHQFTLPYMFVWFCIEQDPHGPCFHRAEACMLSRFSHVWLFVTPWTVARQAPLSLGFSKQEYWSGLPCLSPGDLPDPKI